MEKIKFTPVRDTSPVSNIDVGSQETTKLKEQIIQNIDRAMGKWKKVINLLDSKFGEWEMNPDNTPMPEELKSLLLSIDPKNPNVLTYRTYKKIIRRSLALWGVDPEDVALSSTGFPASDDRAMKSLITDAVIRMEPDGSSN